MIVLALVAFMLLQTPLSFSSHPSSVAAAGMVKTSIHAAPNVGEPYSPTYVKEDPFSIYLGNGFVEIQFDKTKGGILSITNKITGREYTSAGPFFRIHLTGPIDTWLGSQGAGTFEHSYSAMNKTSVLHFTSHFTKAQGYSADASVDIRVFDNSSLSYWSFALKNYGAAAADQIQFPILSNAKPPAASSNDYAIIPDPRGSMLHNPFQTLAQGFRGNDYPSSTCPLQMMVVGNALGGLYFATYDTTGAVKTFGLWRDSEQNVNLAITHRLPESAGSDVVLPYETVIGVFEGDWQNAADIYREWALKQWWTAQGPLYGRDDIPPWFKNGFVVLILNGYLGYPSNTVWATFSEIPSRLSAAVHLANSPVLLEWQGWEQYGTWLTPDVFPPKEGWDAFKHTVNSIHGMGQHVIVALTGGSEYVTPAFNRSMWLQCAEKNKDGTLKDSNFSIGGDPNLQAQGFWISPSCKLFQDWLVSSVVQLAEAGVDGVRLDAVFYGPYDYNPQDTSHPAGYGSWYAQSWVQLLTRVSAEARRVNPQFILGNEGMPEIFLPFHEVFIDDAGLLGNSWFSGIYGNAVEQTGLFDYVYNDYIVGFSRDIPSQSASEPLALTLGVTVDLGTVANFFRHGTNFYLPKGTLPPSLSLASSTFAKDFVMFGRTLRPPKIDVPKTNITLELLQLELPSKLASYNFTLPAVLVGAWSAPDNRLGYVFVNIDEKPWQLKVKIDPNHLDPLKGRNLSLVFVNEDGIRTEAFSASDASISLTVPPQKALTVQIAPTELVPRIIQEYNNFKRAYISPTTTATATTSIGVSTVNANILVSGSTYFVIALIVTVAVVTGVYIRARRSRRRSAGVGT